jgi:hypothetical protein
MPHDLYKHFLWVYPVFLQFQSIRKTKATKIIMDATVLFNNQDNDKHTDHDDDQIDDDNGDGAADNDENADPGHDEDPTQVLSDRPPLDLLCLACFGSDLPPPFLVLCFDACMQQRLLDRTLFNQSDKCSDGRCFVDPAIYTPDDDDDEVGPPNWCSIND